MLRTASGTELIAELGDRPGCSRRRGPAGLAQFTGLAVVRGPWLRPPIATTAAPSPWSPAARRRRRAAGPGRGHVGPLGAEVGWPQLPASPAPGAALATAPPHQPQSAGHSGPRRAGRAAGLAPPAANAPPEAIAGSGWRSAPRYATPGPGPGGGRAAAAWSCWAKPPPRPGLSVWAAWLRAADAAAHAAGAPPATARPGSRRDGSLWTLAYAGVVVRMRHAKGLSDLAVLLRPPPRPAGLRGRPGHALPPTRRPAALASLGLGADEVLEAATARQPMQDPPR